MVMSAAFLRPGRGARILLCRVAIPGDIASASIPVARAKQGPAFLATPASNAEAQGLMFDFESPWMLISSRSPRV